MKKTNKKTTKKQINIFAVLAIILALLIVAMIAFSIGARLKVQGVVNKYIAHEYGEKGNVKMRRSAGTNDYGQSYDMWATENGEYIYDVLTNRIYDAAKTTANSEAVTTALTAYAESVKEDGFEASNITYITYTNPDDITQDYSAIAIYPIATTGALIESTDEAAEIAWNFVTAYENYEDLTGVEINVYDLEHEYTVYVDPFEGNKLSLDILKDNTTLATENSYLYTSWVAEKTAEEEVEVEDDAVVEEDATVEEDTDEPEAE